MKIKDIKLKKSFKIERERQKLAEENNLSRLKKLYSPKYPTIEDLNTSIFWNNKFNSVTRLSDQDGMTKDRIKAVVDFIPNKRLKILDIGAGMGFVEEILSKNSKYSLFGNDFSDTAIHRLNQEFSGEFKKMSLYEMNYPAKSFDVVLALEVLEHIPPHKIFNVLKVVNDLMKKDGLFIVSVPMNEGLEEMYPNNPNSHLRMYTPSLIKAELEIAGFEEIANKKFYAFNKNYFIKKYLSKFLKSKWKPNNIVIKVRKK